VVYLYSGMLIISVVELHQAESWSFLACWHWGWRLEVFCVRCTAPLGPASFLCKCQVTFWED